MLKRHIISLSALLLIVICSTGGDKTCGNDSFQLGDDENADIQILSLVQKTGFNFPVNRTEFDFGVADSA